MRAATTRGVGAVLAMCAALAAVLAACGPKEAAGGVPAAAYVTALTTFLPAPPADPDVDLPVVYVAPIGESALALDAQVAVIDALAERCDVRFVDTFDVVIDEGEDGAPPRDDATLLAIGMIPADPPHTVRVEEYTRAGRTAAHLVTVAERDEWVVLNVEEVDPEVLVGHG